MNKPNIQEIMKKAQEMQKKMQETQNEIEKKQVTGESGAGLVKITMNGKHEVSNVSIDAEIFSEEKEVLEDLIAAAFNNAVKKVAETSKNSFSNLPGDMGIDLPPGLNDLFGK